MHYRVLFQSRHLTVGYLSRQGLMTDYLEKAAVYPAEAYSTGAGVLAAKGLIHGPHPFDHHPEVTVAVEWIPDLCLAEELAS